MEIKEMQAVEEILKNLNAQTEDERLLALKTLIGLENEGKIQRPIKGEFVNNHIHTIYSFSPYSPTAALYYARSEGLITAGIMDHDSVGGCKEFIKAGEIANIPVTCGFETRVRVEGTKLYGKRINNPDQNSIAYVAVHGIPHQYIDKCNEFLAPFREKRNIRNQKMTEKINEILAGHNLSLDFEKDIKNISMSHEKGTITERHITCGLANLLISKLGKGTALVDFLKQSLQISLSQKIEQFLLDTDNIHYVYDLIGALKSDFVPKFYIDATEECPTVTEYIDFVNSIGAISAYAYLGDIESSVTGDKKAQTFEDSYLELLFSEISKLGFKAITYMPSRNTDAQLKRVSILADEYNLFQISGEDINTSRQSFICKELLKPEYAHLIAATFALIGHEQLASENIEDGIFSKKSQTEFKNIREKVSFFEQEGKKLIK